VHLADYPVADPSALDGELEAAMESARRVVELGRRVRTEAKVRVRQPLSRAVIQVTEHEDVGLLAETAEQELNVKEVSFADASERFGRWRAKPNFRALGPALGARVKGVARALADDDGTTAAALARGETVSLDLGPDGIVALGPQDVDLVQEVAEGYGIASDAGVTVALALELTDELRREGIARELVRVIQDARKAADLAVGDRIDLGVETSGEVAASLREHGGYVAAETLAVSLSETALAGGHREHAEIGGEPVLVSVRMAVPSP